MAIFSNKTNKQLAEVVSDHYPYIILEPPLDKLKEQNISLQTPWSESASELYRPSDRRLSAKLVPTFADRGCHVVSVTDPHGRILGVLDRHLFTGNKNFESIPEGSVLLRLHRIIYAGW
jgi:hypothetical protein